MPVSSESGALDLIDSARRVFLLEPDYERKYPPLALMKIASRVRQRGGKVKFARHYLGEACDLICVTSLFTHEAPRVLRAVRQALDLGAGVPVLVGGVYASLMATHLLGETGDVPHVFTGYSKGLDQSVPDYSIDWGVEAPWDSLAYVFTSRGCVNKCAYCAVPRIERDRWINPAWREHVTAGGKRGVMLGDNNLLSCDRGHVRDVFRHIRESGMTAAIDSGLEAALVTAENAEWIAGVDWQAAGEGSLRLAFDRIKEEESFLRGVLRLKATGKLSDMIAFVLFNFTDTPREADYRMRRTYSLGVVPYPQRYQKLSEKKRFVNYAGKHWTGKLAAVFRRFWGRAGKRSAGRTLDRHLVSNWRALRLGPEEEERWSRERSKWDVRPWEKIPPLFGARGREAGAKLARRALAERGWL